MSPISQFFVVACAAVGTIYGMSRNGDRQSTIGCAIGAVFVLAIVGTFLFLKRTK